MNYELAKKLKDAGFQQEGNGTNSWNKIRKEDGAELVYYPTLSELIEACWDSFILLARVPDTDSYVWWIALDKEGENYRETTPEEAVANLWLALNEKKP